MRASRGTSGRIAVTAGYPGAVGGTALALSAFSQTLRRSPEMNLKKATTAARLTIVK
jgi:hypothetical protein